MEEEFYGIIKLVSGEEIFSKVCVSEEEHETLILLDTPVTLETIVIRQLGMTTVKVEPWLKYADDSMYVIKMDKVITITEVNDLDLIKMHQKYIIDKNKKSGKTTVTPNMGFVSKVSDARKSLEQIYRNS